MSKIQFFFNPPSEGREQPKYTDADTYSEVILGLDEKLHAPRLTVAESERLNAERLRLVALRNETASWNEQFAGKVPDDWVQVPAGMAWHNVYRDIMTQPESLTPAMVDAAVHHPNGHVRNEVARRVPLSDEQLTFLFSVINAQWQVEEIESNQATLRQGQDS